MRSGGTAHPRPTTPYAPGLGVAQARHPRAGTGGYHYYNGYHGYHGYHGHGYYGHGYYGGYYYGYPSFYGSLYFGWPSYYGSYYWPGYYAPYPYYGSTYYGYPTPGYGYAPGDQGGDTGVDRSGYSEGDAGMAAGEDNPPAARRDDNRQFGRLRLEVRPDDASIYVNDRFQGMAREIRTLDLPPGRHRIEVVRPGYRTEQREVQIAPGETSEVSVELRRP